MGMVDWSELQQDLLGEIAKSIGCVEDFLVFSRVCPYWRLAAIKENWVVSDAQFPWLVLAEQEYESESSSENIITNNRGFFNLSNGKRYDLDAPQLHGCRMWGSSLGFIVTLNINLDLRLVNPLTQFQLSLPHLYTLKYYHRPNDPNALEAELIDWEGEDPRAWYMCYFIKKAILFKSKNQIMAATIYGERHFLAISRPGDECWTEVEKPPHGFIKDVLLFNGQLFVVHGAGTLLLCEFDDQDIPKLVTIANAPTEIQRYYNHYLVESMGDLLMVVRKLVYYPVTSEFSYKTESFDVYKLDFEKKVWVELKDLGDNALFLGNSSTMSLCSSNVDGCSRNAIYFTDDNYEQWDISPRTKKYGGYDIGVFYLDENVVHTIPKNSLGFKDLHSTFCCPFWMRPSLF